jgi:transposase
MDGTDSRESWNAFVGIDVSKQFWDVHVLPSGIHRSLGNDDAGLKQLLAILEAAGRCLIVVEATGGFERRLVGELMDAGHQVSVVNPRQVRDFAKGIGQLAKTDRIDARVLALFAEKVQPRPWSVVVGSWCKCEPWSRCDESRPLRRLLARVSYT